MMYVCANHIMKELKNTQLVQVMYDTGMEYEVRVMSLSATVPTHEIFEVHIFYDKVEALKYFIEVTR
jgi:hypothetical protein